MIRTKRELAEYLREDARANGRSSEKAKLVGDVIWKFQRALRLHEFQLNRTDGMKRLALLPRLYARWRFHRLSLKLGFSIPPNVFDKGLSIAHYGTIVVSKAARVGAYCRIHEGVTIGATNGSDKAACIGDRVFLASGAKIIGDVCVADDVAIAANAVVTKSIDEAGTTWGGVPARKISDRDSHANLNANLWK
ncbi:MAG: serine acetyltransferase [Clostridia bacterium]|nr:serine acetyltransferase [Clostridia bacterium]